MLDLEQFIGLDTETHLIAPANHAPLMVCLSIADWRGSRVIHRRDSECLKVIETTFDECLHRGRFIAGSNIAFDMGVFASEWPHLWPVVFRMYDEGRVMDTAVRQKLIDIARGEHNKGQRYNLAVLAKRHGYPQDLDKDTWRPRYAELDHVPLKEWPAGAVEYADHDARSSLHVALSQEDESKYLEDQFRQSRAAWALHLIAAWGIRTDRFMVARHRRLVEARLEGYREMLRAADLIYQDKKGEWHKRAKMAEGLALNAWGGNVPRDFQTKGGKPSLDGDAVAALGDPLLIAYQGFSSASTALSHVEELEAGVDAPIHTRWDSLVETGRTSSSGPNLQNRAVEPGDRECFVPRKGNVFLDADFDGNELRSVCQVMINAGIKPRMADVLNEGGDPHAMVAATILGCTYEETLQRIKNPLDQAAYLARQSGKIANFGKYGGLGKAALQLQARAKYKVILSDDEVESLLVGWTATWPESREYFAWIRNLTSTGGAWIQHFGSNRWRGDIPYTVCCNTFFQGLAADETKAALYALVRECYIGRGILRGSRVVNFIHDQYITEVPESDQLQEFADAYQKLLTDAANEWLPDVPTRAKPHVARRWSKLAKPTKDARGRLVPWEWAEATKAGSPGYAT